MFNKETMKAWGIITTTLPDSFTVADFCEVINNNNLDATRFGLFDLINSSFAKYDKKENGVEFYKVMLRMYHWVDIKIED